MAGLKESRILIHGWFVLIERAGLMYLELS